MSATRVSLPVPGPGPIPAPTHPPIGVNGDFSTVVEEHAARVYRLARRLTGNHADAEDLTQETFLRALRAWDSYVEGTVGGWLHRIATNLFLDHTRRRSRLRIDAWAPDFERLLPSRAAADDEAVAMLLDPEVEAALCSLSPTFRATVVLADIEGLSYEEIASVMDTCVGTVRSRLHRARAMLRRELAHRAPGPGRQRYSGPLEGPRLVPQT